MNGWMCRVASVVMVLGCGLPAVSLAQTDAGTASGTPGVRERLRERWLERREDRQRDREATSKPSEPGDHAYAFSYAGETRRYRVHVPRSYDPSAAAPVVFAFHGGGGNMDLQANDAYYGLISKSESAGFVAVFPNGSSRLPGDKLATWNAGNCCGHARDAGIDDVGFVREIVRRVQAQYRVDPQRIFATGMSNGAMMSYRLACEMPDVFRAITAVAGTDNTQSCTPSRPVSVLHIHARDDELELFNGGAGRDSKQVTSFVSVPASVAKWVKLNGCPSAPRRVLEAPGAMCETHAGCRDGAEVTLCVTETGGHSWPGGTKPRGGGKGSTALSATDQMWSFFSRH